MEIYVVQSGDNIYSIADKYGVTVAKLIQDNGLENPYSLVPGQTIVITYPNQTHTVKEGDTLTSIANTYEVTIMQLLRNNPFLSDREYIYPGEEIVISFNTYGKVTANGYAYPYINKNTLIKTLPYLTYISVFNYMVTKAGEIITYSDDAEIIQSAKDYGVAPLLMVSSISPQGVPNIEVVYEVLTNEKYHDRLVNNFLDILKTTGYYGVNLMISGINATNQTLYLDLLTDISKHLKENGYPFFLTINPYIKYSDNKILYEQLDFTSISQLVNGITFLHYIWGSNFEPPAPISSIDLEKDFIEYVVTLTPPDKIDVGKLLIGYDWELPYIPNKSHAYSLTINSAITLANDAGATIQFDEKSQTPFFLYIRSDFGVPMDHIVWFIDARSINAIDKLIAEFGLSGSGTWNIMIYNQQVWTLTNSQYEIIKVIPDNLK